MWSCSSGHWSGVALASRSMTEVDERRRQLLSHQIPRRFDQAPHWRSHGPAGVDRLVEGDIQRVLQQSPSRVLPAGVLACGASERAVPDLLPRLLAVEPAPVAGQHG